MIVVIGHLSVEPVNREALLTASTDAVRAARDTPGCLDYAVSADLLDPGRVNVAERWTDRAALDSFRDAGPDDATNALITGYDVAEYEVTAADQAD